MIHTKRTAIVPLGVWEALQLMSANAKFTTQIIAAKEAQNPVEALDFFSKEIVPKGKLICLNVDQPAQKEEFSWAQVQTILNLCQPDLSSTVIWGATTNTDTEHYCLELMIEI